MDIILASASPRRREILEKYNLKHRVKKSDIIEHIRPDESPEQIAMSLAFQKAYNIALENKKSIVIGADTIVVYDNRILGKPTCKKEAKEILNLLNGQKHQVITAIALVLLDKNIKIVDYEETLVKFRDLDEDIIDRYVKTREPFDKAGAYGIQDYGALLVEEIRGCYLNVVGLPLSKLNNLLNIYFNISLL
ncbi:MAG TPA: Maf family protein [Tissierellaceae bacterium]|nr:Maf family protein [Tissierellaceae bacterium]